MTGMSETRTTTAHPGSGNDPAFRQVPLRMNDMAYLILAALVAAILMGALALSLTLSRAVLANPQVGQGVPIAGPAVFHIAS
jgi:hypothetical protein